MSPIAYLLALKCRQKTWTRGLFPWRRLSDVLNEPDPIRRLTREVFSRVRLRLLFVLVWHYDKLTSQPHSVIRRTLDAVIGLTESERHHKSIQVIRKQCLPLISQMTLIIPAIPAQDDLPCFSNTCLECRGTSEDEILAEPEKNFVFE